MEMVMPFSSNGKTDMFKTYKWKYETHSQYCYDTYKVRPQDDMVMKIYGGKDLRGHSNIIFR